MKIPVGSPRKKRQDTLKLDLEDLGCGGVKWTYLVQDGDQCCHMIG